MKAGNALGEHLELLLRAVLSKMQGVETSSVMQSLLVVFAHLIQTNVSFKHCTVLLNVTLCYSMCSLVGISGVISLSSS